MGRPLILVHLLAGPLLGAQAYAGASGSTDISCGSAAVYWNAPNGAVVFNRGAGPIKDVVSAVGESRSHSMLSNASVGYVTHAVAKTPGRPGWPDYCSTPLTTGDLQNGWAGAEQINQGAIYTYLYSNGSQEFVYFQNGNGDGTNKGGQIADWAWNTAPYVSVAAQGDGGQTIYRLLNSNGNAMNYVLYQFRSDQNARTAGSNWSDGIICSTLLATMQANTLGSSYYINNWTYSHTELNTGLNTLYNSVYSQCSNKTGFWASAGAAVTCLDSDLCDEAADQVSNCMSGGNCGSSDHSYWTGIANNSSTTATTMSPDHIGGWNGHPYTGSGVSVWAYDNSNTVTWSSSGNVYGCWY
jgi:hypothetical protein